MVRKLLVDKAKVKEYADSLRADFIDLCHQLDDYVKLWIERAEALRLVGAWWDYMVLITHAKSYIRRNCPCFLSRFEKLLKSKKNRV